jgi:2-oxo-4-hydroxy-4-carboxy--5-ureidoimidazoline (OHCU) decarboxylase
VPGGFEPDELDGREFTALMAPLVENAPAYLARLTAARPFSSWKELFRAATELALTMPIDDQIELIDAHPRIGAPPGSVSALSFVEQGYDAEAAGVEAEAERGRIADELTRLNVAYEARFGFRYVIFVAGRPRRAIMPLMERSLEAEEVVERERALMEVVAIARDRAVKTEVMPQDAGWSG